MSIQFVRTFSFLSNIPASECKFAATMPAPLPVDWNIAKELYLGGMPLRHVAKKCAIPYDALRQKALRYRWKQDDIHVTQRVANAVAACRIDDACDIVKQGNAWKRRVLTLADKHLDELEKRDVGSLILEDFDTLSRIAERTDGMARRAIGLDTPAGTHVTIAVQGELSTAVQPKQLSNADVIDIEPEPQESAGDVKG
jgi:hypothetical protein